MPEYIVCNEKESASHQSSQATGLPSGGASPAHDLHDNRPPSDTSDVTKTSDNNLLIVDWDGPDDPSNPRKYV